MRETVQRQLAPYFKPGDVRYTVITRTGRVIGAYERLADACALVRRGRTVYTMTAEPWLRGKTRVFLSYDINKRPRSCQEEERGE